MKNKILVCILLFVNASFSQLQNNTWYFSPTAKGIQFNFATNIPTVVTGHAPLTCIHGCGIANDQATGAVLFYTDALKVYDATNTAMPNGVALSGGVSCAMKGQIAQIPGSCKRYYVFCDDANSPTSGSLKYSIVNLNLPGNGTITSPLGDVEPASLNTLITTNATESFIIAPNTTSSDYWLIAPMNGGSTIKVFSVTATGITLSSTYNTGTTFNSSMTIKYSAVAGKVAYGSVVELEPALIMDFNAATGVLSGAAIIPGTPLGTCTNIYNGWHDFEFSPDGTKLYMTKYRMYTPASAGRIYQYDLNLPANPITPVYINPSADILKTITGLQTGPDGKIYFVYFNTTTGDDRLIGVINNPNLAGAACNVNPAALDLGMNQGNNSRLPIPALFGTGAINLSVTNDTSVCIGNLVTLTATGATTYQWSGGSSATTSFINVNPINATEYYITGTSGACTATDSVKVNVDTVPVISFSSNQIICAGQSVNLNASGAQSYQWVGLSNTSGSSVVVSPSVTTTYYVNGINGACTSSSGSITVTVNPSPMANISTPNSYNFDSQTYTINNAETDGDSCILYFGNGDSVLGCNWSTISYEYTQSGNYIITQIVTNSLGCSDVSYISLNVDSDEALYIPNAITPNGDGTNDIFMVKGFGIEDLQLLIFDRWGELIFQSDDMNKGWNGTYMGNIVQEGVYVWKVNYNTKKKKDQHKIGSVTVVR